MSLSDLIKDGRRVFASNKLLREEDDLRSLAVNERKNFRLPIVYANNDFFLTNTGAWTGFAVPNKPWGFLDESSRKQYFYSAGAIFDRIFPADKENAGHLLVTNRVYSADDWEQALLAKYADTASEDFARYVKASRANIERREFFERECYLFARTGARGAGGGLKGWVRNMIESFALGSGMDDSQPDEEEIKFWTQQAVSVGDTLSSSWLAAQPVHRRRVEWVVRHLDTPGLPTPETAPADEQEWGAGEWRTVLSSYTREVDLGTVGRNRYRCVEFEAPVGAGKTYAAYLPLNHIPNQLYGGTNWIHHASALAFPVDVSLRFEIIDPDRAEKELEKPIFAAEAQEEEDAEAGYRPDETTQIQQQGLRQVKTSVRMGRQPLTFWQAVFCVYDTDKDELLSKVTKLIKHYNDIQFKLECPRNDQRELFYQSFPGSDVLVEDWMHRTDTQYLAASMPWLTSSVGDRDDSHGLWQGHTIVRDANGVPKKGVPVFFDLQNVVDDEGKAPTEVVCGFPGSGKRLALDTKIATGEGFKRVDELQVGDQLFDELGNPCTLTALHPIEANPQAYKITFDDGTTVMADAEHRWTTETRASRMSEHASSRDRRRTPKGSEQLRDHLVQLITTTDPEEATTPTNLQREIDAALDPGRASRSGTARGQRGAGTPYRDVYLRLAKSLPTVGTYVQHNHHGGGRRYPLYSKVAFCKVLLDWAEQLADDQRHRRVLPQTRTTEEIARTAFADGGRPNHSIPVSGPIRYPERELGLDPYLLGAWLGDGRSNGAGEFTSEDPEIIQAFELAGFPARVTQTRPGSIDYYISGLTSALRPLGVINNKHIPDDYLFASIEQRLALLQGLMDTDGSVTRQGTCEFYASDEKLAIQVRSLVASLGMKTTMRSKQGSYVDREGVRHQTKIAYTVSYSASEKVVRLSRKCERLVLTDHRSTTERRYIVSVVAAEPVPMRCLTVDSASHLFLCTDQYIATHNTVSRGLKVAHEDALRGITQFVWDPKGDFLPLKRYAKRMRLDPEKVKLVDLYDPKNSVSLDAFALAEVDPKNNIDERVTSALDVFSALCRDYVESQDGIGYQSMLRSAVLSVMEDARQPGARPPSMQAVLDTIKRWRNKDFTGLRDLEDEDRAVYQRYARILDDHLSEGVKSSVLGQLLFRDPYEYGTMKVNEGDLIIFVAIKMNPTDPGQKPTMSSAISDVISGLMTDYIRSLLFTLPDEVSKAAIFDEWHVIKRTSRAQALLDWLRRMGRSKRCAVRQMSQSALDFEKGSLSAVWCGYAQNEDEARRSCELLGIEDSESNIRLLQSLTAGQFLFRDSLGRVAHVAVDIWDDWLLSKFNTQAKAKAAMLAEMRASGEIDELEAADLARSQQAAIAGNGSRPDDVNGRGSEAETVGLSAEPATQSRR